VGSAPARYRGDIVSAFQYGLVIFTLTALLGLANATQIFGVLSRDTLLTHLHSGTLGWITMGVFGLSRCLHNYAMTRAMRMDVRVSAVVTALYVLAFSSGNFYARAIFGVAMLAIIVSWWWWVAQRSMRGFGSLSLPKLALFLALTTLLIG